MMKPRVIAVVAASVIAVLLSGCGSGSGGAAPAPSITVHGPSISGPGPSSTAVAAGAPNPCALLNSQMAKSLTGLQVLPSGGPQTYGPNILCEYRTTTSGRAIADLSLEATYLRSNSQSDTPAEWDYLVHARTRGGPITVIPSLSTPGHYGWSYGPVATGQGNDMYIDACGFAKHGYGYDLSGSWLGGERPPAQTALLAACSKIALQS
jgi:hypothetical protein